MLFPDDWAAEPPRHISTLQAAELWAALERGPWADMVAFQQNLPLLPYTSTAKGEIQRLKWIAAFLLMWAMTFAQFVEEREKQIKLENAPKRRKGPAKKEDDDDD